MRSSLETVQSAIAKAESRLKDLRAKESELLAQNLKVTCTRCANGPSYPFNDGCGAEFPIGEITYLQTHWYVEPSGCSGGDYFKEGEGNWICPKCGGRNRLGYQKEIQKQKRLFKAYVDEYPR